MNTLYDENDLSTLNLSSETLSRINELTAPLNEMRNRTAQITAPIMEFQKQIAEILAPAIEFQKRISAIIAPFTEYAEVASAIRVLGKNQFVFWNRISKGFALEILGTENINRLMLNHYTENNSTPIKETILSCKSHKSLKPYTCLFLQAISAYNRKQYHLCIMGLLGIVDGLLSQISGKTGTHIESRAKIIINKLSNDVELTPNDFSIWVLYSTFTDFMESIGVEAPFKENEPNLLNRHWIMHGRTKKKISQIDCIKIINSIYGILLFNELGSEEVELPGVKKQYAK